MQDLQANARKRKSDDNISKDILTLNRGEENETSKKRFQSSSSLVRSDSVLVPRGIDEVVDMETMMSQYLPTNIPTNYALSVRNRKFYTCCFYNLYKSLNVFFIILVSNIF